MNQVLYIFSGLPGSGKSTISQDFSMINRCVYLRIDTIEQGFRDLCDIEVYDEGYHLSHRVAEDNLRLGLSVVADSCNPIELSRQEWELVAKSTNSKFINVEVICSDDVEHKSRLENRIVSIQRLKSPTWEEVSAREYHPWTSERIILDTAGKKIEESLQELILHPNINKELSCNR